MDRRTRNDHWALDSRARSQAELRLFAFGG
ncbi:hypothetical protein DES46_102324 [Caldimonas thermodepolymerans]|nr:hypothetical protein DES46_102324 [Caldimonas thermodepolymerans]